MTKILKVAIYCRLSQEDKDKISKNDDSNSIQNQKAMLQSYALEQGWELFNIYSDDDYTGSDRSRPKFNELLNDAKNHKFDIVLCKTQSRFTRELELVEKYIHGLFPIWGIRFVSVVDNADTNNKGNKKSRQINGLVNEWYLEDLSDNIKSVLTEKRKNGLHIGAFALYGYKKDPNQKGHLIIDEEAAQVVREVFTLFSQGYGKTAIARILNERGLPNPTEYKRLHGLRSKQPTNPNSTLWKYYSISDMLTNEIYIGHMVQGKYGSVSYKTKQNKPRPKESWYKVENTHEPIIDMELWDKVQNLIQQKTKPFSNGKLGLFSGKVYCIHCGYALRTSKNRDKYYLKCGTRYVSKNSCVGAFIPVSELEKIVLDEIRKISRQYLDKEALYNQVSLENDLDNTCSILKKSIQTYQEKIKEINNCLKLLYLDKTKKIITDQDYIQLSNDFKIDKENFEKKLSQKQLELEHNEKMLKKKKDKLEIINRYTDINQLDREIIGELIDRILVGKRDSETKQVPIKIYWNF